MTDERNIAHDKTVALDKKHQGRHVVENSAIMPQQGKKPPLIDADTGPSNSVAHQMYKDGLEPRVHSAGSEPGQDHEAESDQR